MFLEAEVNEVMENRYHPRSGHHPGRHHNGCPSETQCSCSYAPGLTGDALRSYGVTKVHCRHAVRSIGGRPYRLLL